MRQSQDGFGESRQLAFGYTCLSFFQSQTHLNENR